MKEKNGKVIKVIIFLILIFASYIFYRIILKLIVVNKEFIPLSPSGNMIYQIDSLREENGKIVLEGFAFLKNKNSDSNDKWLVLLHDMETGKNIYLNTKKTVRKDVNEYFKCQYDYTYSGFSASIKKNKVDLVNGKYQIYLYYFETDKRDLKLRKYGMLEEYIIDGKLYNVNLLECKPFDFSDTELDDLFKDAELRVCSPEGSMSVYQKNGELYWVVDESFHFSEKGKTYIEYRINTTQIDKLPKECIDKKRIWSNLQFSFETNEIYGDFKRFRVAKLEIPREYSVTNICTGYRENSKWVMQQYFFVKYNLLWESKEVQ